jgi:sulfoacetaldehyde dehydrogenase
LGLSARPADFFVNGRLNYPVTYWNGLASLLMTGFWLALGLANRAGASASTRAGAARTLSAPLLLALAVLLLDLALLPQSRGALWTLFLVVPFFVIFSPHPRSKKTSFETVRLMREALEREGAPADILQCLTKVNIPMSQALMARADLIVATGGQPMVRAAYSSGTPAYGVGAGNSTMIIDETANIEEAARNTRLSKTSDFGSGCSADGNLIIEASIFDKLLKQLQAEGGYLANESEKAALRRAMWDDEAHRTPNTVAIAPQQLAKIAGFSIPADRKFIIVYGDGIGKEHAFSSEKLTTLLAVYKYKGFEQALEMMRGIYEVGGKGHSCGIYSFNQDHIHQLALAAPVSRIMVRQPQSKANAGAFNNGMPMTSSLGCGTWGGNIVSENVHLKHYLNTTWVSVPIKEDKPSDEELFGPFYDPEMEQEVETITT